MDIKLQTFLTLCMTMNYRETSELMNITQPAVTKQIQSLEQIYNTKLFIYDGRKLKKTESCKILESSAKAIRYNYEDLKRKLEKPQKRLLRVGATKTIGDYVIKDAVARYLNEKPENELSLIVDNTEHLLNILDKDELDFALIEGVFDKKVYDYRLYKQEPYIGICSKDHPFCGKVVTLKELFNQTILVREEGSGTRNILERELSDVGYNLNDFMRTVCIGSFSLMKELIRKNVGISMVYQAVIAKDEDFGTFEVENFSKVHEFNIVYLHGTVAKDYAEEFFDR